MLLYKDEIIHSGIKTCRRQIRQVSFFITYGLLRLFPEQLVMSCCLLPCNVLDLETATERSQDIKTANAVSKTSRQPEGFYYFTFLRLLILVGLRCP